MIHSYAIDASSLPLTPENVLHEMGYGKVEPKAEVATLIVSMLEEVKALAAPSCTFLVEKGKMCNDTVLLNNGAQFGVGKILGSLLTGSESFALFTATAGENFQQYQKSFSPQDDILCCFIADVIGTLLVEAVGDRMEFFLKQQIHPLKHTHRFSPGYCGWPLTEQKNLFAQMGGNPCGIRLSDVYLMTPEKSISGLIGIGPQVNEKVYGCRYCNLETCYKRKKRK